MMENRSFDHFLGWVPGANGRQAGQTFHDANGNPQQTHRLVPDWQGCGLADPPHGYYDGRIDVNGGKMDGFLHAESTGDTFPVGYYTADDLPFYAGCAQKWTICDSYHSGILASTQPNRMYIHCGQTDRTTTGSGLPATSTLPTIWDAASAAGVKAGYYFNNLPYTAIWDAKYLGITKLYSQFAIDAAAGNLPSISYVDPFFYESGLDDLCNDDHPFADVRNGQAFLNGIYDTLRSAPTWGKTLMVVCYDEWGGFFDHVVPPYMPVSGVERNVVGNDGQLGIRVPCILIGPRAKQGHVDSTLFEPNSILKFMEWRWNLTPLGVRSAVTNNIAYALDFSDSPRTDAPAFSVPANVLNSEICAFVSSSSNSSSGAGGASSSSGSSTSNAAVARNSASSRLLTPSMAEHAHEVQMLQQKARLAGFRW